MQDHWSFVNIYLVEDLDYDGWDDVIQVEYNSDAKKLKHNHDTVRIIHLNIQNIKNKLDSIEIILKKFNPDVLILSETHLNEAELPFYNLFGYNSFHCIRLGRKGGGIGIFIKSMFDSSVIYEKSDDFDSFLGIYIKQLKCSIFGIYKSNNPNHNDDTFFHAFSHILKNFKNSYLFGDFNFDLLLNSSVISKYKDLIDTYGFKVLNKISTDMATRIDKFYNRKSILDHLITNNLKKRYLVSVLENSISDHQITVLDTYIKFQNSNQLKIRTTVRIDQVISSLSQIDQLQINNYNDLNDHIQKLIKNSSTTHTFKNRCKDIRKPFITPEIMKLLITKEKLYKLKKKFPDSVLIDNAFKFCRNKIANMIKYNKKVYYSKQFENNLDNPRKTWLIIKESLFNSNISQKQLIIPDFVHINNIDSNDKVDIVNILNEQFVNVENPIPTYIPIDENFNLDSLFIQNKFNFERICNDDIVSAISKLKSNVSQGLDNISCKIIKAIPENCINVLCYLFNTTIESNEFPKLLKHARITPIYKSGDKNNPLNYRAISILPIISKVFEHIMLEQISYFFNTNNIINKNQYGFLSKSNTTSACIGFVDNIQQSLDNKKFTACLSIDLKKAFDSVNHEILLIKLNKYGFSNNAINLISSYLSERFQRVVIDSDISSSDLEIKTGVPQGSVLGPMLFLAFINDMFELSLYGKLTMYADDAMLAYEAESITELNMEMQSDITTIEEYLKCNLIQMNVKKTCFMLIGKSNKCINNFTIKTSNDMIARVTEMKYLGLYLNCTFSWDTHINYIKKKISPYPYVFYRLRKFLGSSLLLKLYYAFFHSRLIYMNSIWSSAPKLLINKLAILQNKAIKSIYKLPYLTPTVQLYNENILSLATLNQYEMILLFKKMIDGHIKHSFILQKNSDFHQYFTRRVDDFHQIQFNSKYGKNRFLIQASVSFNQLPESIKNITSISKFKNELKKYLSK